MFPLSGVRCTSNEIAWAASLWSFMNSGHYEILNLMLAGSAGYSCLICMHRIPFPRHLDGEASGKKCRSSIVVLSSYLLQKKKKEKPETLSALKRWTVGREQMPDHVAGWKNCGSLSPRLWRLLRFSFSRKWAFHVLHLQFCANQRQEASISVVLSCWKDVGGFESAIDQNYVWGLFSPAFYDGSLPIIWHSEGAAGV